MENAAALKLVELEDVEGGLETLGWTIADLDTLDWALSRMADSEREVEENNKLAQEAIGRIKLKTEILNERAEKAIAFFRSQIAAYAETHRAELLGGGKKKSRTLLHGTIGWRKKGGALEMKDAAALLDWARLQPIESNVLRIKEEPAWDVIKKSYPDAKSGEIPPGCDVVPETEEITIKPALGGVHGS